MGCAQIDACGGGEDEIHRSRIISCHAGCGPRAHDRHTGRGGSPDLKGVSCWGAVMRLSVSYRRNPGGAADSYTVLCNYPIHRRRRRAIDAPPRGAGILISIRTATGYPWRRGRGRPVAVPARRGRAADVLLRFRFVGREQARAAWNRTLRRRTATVRVASCEVVCRVTCGTC